MKETPKSQELPIDEVDAQMLFFTIRELHKRRCMGMLRAAYVQIGDIFRGEKWPDPEGENTSSQTEQ